MKGGAVKNMAAPQIVRPAPPQLRDFFPVNAENSLSGPKTDLFGNPLLPLKDPRGRKAYSKSKENQLLVIDLRAAGMKHSEIALVLGCDEKTLRKYYSRELEEASILVQAEAVRVLMHKMRTGNLSATRQVLEISSLQHAPKKTKQVESRPEPVGKKRQLDEAAADVPEGWGDLLGGGQVLN